MGFSGLRPHELVEASTADFRWDDGELRFDIRTDHRQGDEATLKTKESTRFLTIHSSVRDLVWAHIEQRRVVLGGEGRIFDLPRYGGRSGRAATNRIGLWLRKIEGLTLEPRQSFYSLRHNAVTEFERMALAKDITETLAAFLTGHSTGKTVRGSIYIHRSKEVAAAIEKLPNPFEPVGAAQEGSLAAPPLVDAAQPL
jgi:integrase